jgi:pimeloyl-ACP methyl ester carboxylesterase
MHPRAGRRALAVTVALAVGLGACSPAPTPVPTGSAPSAAAPATGFTPTFVEAPCPDDIEILALVDHSCGYLTVLEDRSKPTGRTIQLLMVRTPVPDAAPREGTGGGFGGDLGYAFASVVGEGASRTRLVTIQLDTRGSWSEPGLGCSEVDALDAAMAEVRSGDASLRSRLVDAVATCRQRLADAGIDVAMYDVANHAADLEDLRRTLGLGNWTLDTKGDTSLYTFEYLRHWSDQVGSVVLDSPRFPQNHDPDAGLQAIEYAWSRFVAGCLADTGCAELLPDPTATLRGAVARLDAGPVPVEITSDYLAVAAGRPVMLLVDGQRLLRAVRYALGGDGPENARRLPAMIERAARGEVDLTLSRILGGNSPLCVGFRPQCGGRSSFMLAQFLTVMCRDIVPFDAPPTAATLAADTVGWASLYEGDPVRAVCPAWDVPPADPSVAEPVTSEVPMLVYSGELDSWSARPLAEGALGSLPNAHYYELAGQTHNVMGFTSCSVVMRNEWLDDPMSPPPDASCLAELHPVFEVEPPPN